MTAIATEPGRFLRPVGTDAWEVHLGGDLIGRVVAHPRGGGFRALTRNGNIPMPNGSVLSTDKDLVPNFWEDRPEPVHATPQKAARMIVLAVETGRILNAQIAYERANGWSTD